MSLCERERRLVRLFAAAVLGLWPEVRTVREAAPGGEPDRTWREAILMLHLFAGVPRQVQTYEVLERAGGLGTRGADEVAASGDLPREGRALFERIYGANAPAVAARLSSFHEDFAAWVLGHAYGRVLARPGLTADRRELLAVAALSVLGAERQLASHARGAVRCGASPEELSEVLDVLDGLIEPEHSKRAREVLSRFGKAGP